jgi:hypothetical protein
MRSVTRTAKFSGPMFTETCFNVLVRRTSPYICARSSSYDKLATGPTFLQGPRSDQHMRLTFILSVHRDQCFVPWNIRQYEICDIPDVASALVRSAGTDYGRGNTETWFINRTVIPGPKFPWRTVELYRSEARSLCGIFTASLHYLRRHRQWCRVSQRLGFAAASPVFSTVVLSFNFRRLCYSVWPRWEKRSLRPRGSAVTKGQLQLSLLSFLRSCNTAHRTPPSCERVSVRQSVWLILVWHKQSVHIPQEQEKVRLWYRPSVLFPLRPCVKGRTVKNIVRTSLP